MTGKRIYLQPMDMLLNAIHDLEELQKGQRSICDTPLGLIGFKVAMYASEWEYQFAVTDIGWNRCAVSVEIRGDAPDKQRLIEHEFALIDYVLTDRAKIEFAVIEEEDRRVQSSKESRADTG